MWDPAHLRDKLMDPKTLVDLGSQPLVNNLCETQEDSLRASQYKLCAKIDDDLAIELDTIIDSDVLYKNYLYSSGVSMPYVQHCRRMWHKLKHLKHDVIIDIGGNDGTLLKAFQSQTTEKLRCINVDASESFREQNEEGGIEYINAFFGPDVDVPKADLIISTNVFQHTPQAGKFVEGIAKHLDGGTWILEFPYTLHTIKTLQYDQFYHEHFYYWLVTPLEKLFADHGLKIYHAEEVDIHGGSMRLWITNSDVHAQTNAHQKYIEQEKAIDWDEHRSKIIKKIYADRQFMATLDGTTAFFGAAAKGCVFLNAISYNTDIHPHSYVVDDTPAKQGKFVPGTGLPIRTREFLFEHQPDNVVILAHNFRDFIIKSLRPKYKGRIITMFPDIMIDEAQDHL